MTGTIIILHVKNQFDVPKSNLIMKITVQNLGCVFAIIFGYNFVAPLTCLGYKITDK